MAGARVRSTSDRIWSWGPNARTSSAGERCVSPVGNAVHNSSFHRMTVTTVWNRISSGCVKSVSATRLHTVRVGKGAKVGGSHL